MYRTKTYPRTTLYIAIATAVIISGLLIYGLAHAITQSSLALVAGLMLVVGNGPEIVHMLQQRTIGLAMLNTLIGIALLSFFMVHWLGFIFYLPLVGSLILALPLMLNRVGIARRYVQAIKAVTLQLGQFIRARISAQH